MHIRLRILGSLAFLMLAACNPDSQLLNVAPVFDEANSDDSITLDEDSAGQGTVLADDEDGDTLSFSITDTPSNGTATVDENGVFDYTPLPNFNGADSFVISVSDGRGATDSHSVAVTVNPVNDTPVAEDSNEVVQRNGSLDSQVQASDIDGDTLTYSNTDPANGVLTFNADGSYNYTPSTDFDGEDSFTYTANDGSEDSNTATVNLNVVSFAGTSYDQTLVAHDGETISFTVHEPDELIPGQKYPLVLEGHGYGGSKVNENNRGDGRLYGLLAQGYGIISIDQRGFGSAGGTVRLFDPEFEGRDLIQILDWAEGEEGLDWLLYRDDNLVLGAIGGSYGGGYQHAVHALDPKKRIDALAPEITWHDLRYSLFSGRAFKSYWATLLSAAGNGTGNQDQEVNEGLAEGLTQNNLSQDKLDLLYKHSFISHCEGNNEFTHDVLNELTEQQPLEPVDALYWQSTGDTLFNMNDMFDNVKCLRALGADVRALTKVNGHDGGNGNQCGELTRNQSILDWFNEKLKGEAGEADYIPQNCFNLGGTDGVVTDELPIGGDIEYNVPSQTFAANSNSNAVTSILLATAGENGAVLAGLPTAVLTVTDPVPPNAEVGDPIIFLGIGIKDAGAGGNPTLQMPNQVLPIRGYGEHDVELVGLNVRLTAGQEVYLMIHEGFNARYPNSGSKAATPVEISGTVRLPLLAHDLPTPPAN